LVADPLGRLAVVSPLPRRAFIACSMSACSSGARVLILQSISALHRRGLAGRLKLYIG